MHDERDDFEFDFGSLASARREGASGPADQATDPPPFDLLLWRHAEAEDQAEDLSDLERKLTHRGREQAERMGRWLRLHLDRDTRIVSSPARRCRQTANALGLDYETLAVLDPHASARQVLDAVDWPGARRTVLVVGHQHYLGEVAALLLSGIDMPWVIRRGAVWWLRHRIRHGAPQVVLRAVLGSELLPH